MASQSPQRGSEGSEIDTHAGQAVGVEEDDGTVEIYIRRGHDIVGADLTPAEARKLAAQLIDHAAKVDDCL